MKKSKKNILIMIIIIFLIISVVIIYRKVNEKIIRDKEEEVETKANNIEEISSHYNKYVLVSDDSKIYDDNFKEVGTIYKNSELVLEDINIDSDTKYFKTKINDEIYYIDYKNLEKIDDLTENDSRYRNYILFNQNIITKNITEFYDVNDNLVYKITSSFNLPIIVKYTDRYGVIFDDKLFFIKESSVQEIIDNQNTDKSNANGISVLNYHFIYEDDDKTCNEIICNSASQINKQFTYIKENEYFTPTMKELEMYIDGNINLPKKSVVITFDDGARAEIAKKYVDMYQLNATLFMITSWYDKERFESEYLEVHSHSHNLHDPGVCPGGQGGGIKCMEKDSLLWDLKTSREKLNGSTVFCYPFYEYNDYSIEVLKEAGYTMAFAGPYADGNTKVKVGANKYELPRIVIYSYTTFDQFVNYLQ